MQNRMKYSTSFGNINYGATAQVFKNAPVTFYYCATRQQAVWVGWLGELQKRGTLETGFPD